MINLRLNCLLAMFWALVLVALPAAAQPWLAQPATDLTGAPYGPGFQPPVPQSDWGCEAPSLVEQFAAGTSLYWRDPHLVNRDPCGPALAIHAAPARWYAMVEALPLMRDAEVDVPLATLGAGGPVALSTGDLEYEFNLAPHILLGRALGDWWRVEISYFGTHSWQDLAAARNDDPNALGFGGNLFSPFTDFGNPATAGLDFNALARVDYFSRLNNAEINLRHRLPMPPGRPYETSLLYGARFMDIHEQLDYQTISNAPAPTGATVDYDVTTDNELVGVQIGLLGQFLAFDRTWIDWEIKGAMCHNLASHNIAYANQTAVLQTATASAEQERTAFVGETSLVLNYQVTPQFTWRIGYRALWITGLALAAENFENDLNAVIFGPTELDDTGEVVYHGPSMGLVWTR